MKEKLAGLWTKIKETSAAMGKKQKALLGGGFLFILVGAIVLATILNNKPYEVLFTGLTSEEVASITALLDEMGQSEYRVEGGTTVMVPKDQEAQLKAKLLMKGYPKSGFGYATYLNNVGAMASETDRKNMWLADLQDRMGAVIRCFDGVQEAVVTIAQGEDRRYVLDSANMTETTAGVLVTMRNGQTLSEQQAEAIRNLVARSAQGLTIDNITITDNLGNTYSGEDGSATSRTATELKLNLERQVNNTVRTNVLNVLESIYGPGNVKVSVISTVDVSRRVQESTTYKVPEGATEGKGITNSEEIDQELVRPGGENAGGVAGTTTNSDINNYVNNQATANGDETYIKNNQKADYSVDEFKEQVEANPEITDLMIAVTINSQSGVAVNAEQLRPHIARAAGITTEVEQDKISVLSMSFYADEGQGITTPGGLTLRTWMLYAAGGGVVLLLVLMLVFGLIARKRRKKKEAMALATVGQVPMMMPVGEEMVPAPILEINNEKNMALKKDLRQFTETNPEIAAQMIKAWLKGGGSTDA